MIKVNIPDYFFLLIKNIYKYIKFSFFKKNLRVFVVLFKISPVSSFFNYKKSGDLELLTRLIQ